MDRLKQLFFEKSSNQRNLIREFLKTSGNEKLDEVTVSQAFGGMRGIKSMVWETSDLDADEGITFRGYSIDQLRELLPRVPGGKEPLPEGLFWLMLTAEIPTNEDVKWLSAEWARRSDVPQYVYDVLNTLPGETHPMTQFTIAINALQNESIFAKKYDEGFPKSEYWDATYEDTMNLIAKLPKVAAYIFRKQYFNGEAIVSDDNLDWAANYAQMLGVTDNPDFKSLMRLYLTIHADHEGGNASAHATHLVGSTLSDAYLSLAAGINALAGPLHGLANQEVIKWIFNMLEEMGTDSPTKDQIAEYVNKTLTSGQVVPGYGHAVLRKPDPRFTAQKNFAERNVKDSNVVQVVWDIFEVVPPILESLGKVKNPWPNVDAHSGALLTYYGMNQYDYYTVLFGVSRALGVLAALCWSRALGFPLERPKSLTSDAIMKKFK